MRVLFQCHSYRPSRGRNLTGGCNDTNEKPRNNFNREKHHAFCMRYVLIII